MLALMGMLLPLSIPQAYFYAYEARAYGMVLGFCGAAVVCWDLAHATPWRGLALLGLPLCLAAAVASTLYAGRRPRRRPWPSSRVVSTRATRSVTGGSWRPR